MLEKVAHYNDLSPKLREELQKKIEGFGRNVRFAFKISHPNPDKQKYNGEVIWPNTYVLDPRTFDINDPYEDGPGQSKRKKIGLVSGTDDKGLPTMFKKITVGAGERGIKFFDLNNPDHVDEVAYLLLHPKLQDGKFFDVNKVAVVSLIDEVKVAAEKRTERTARVKALNAAQEMSDKEVKLFADAMLWDSTQEMAVLRDLIEAMAEDTPQFFNDMVESKTVEYMAHIKRAVDQQVIGFDPSEYKFIWSANQQTICVLQPTEGKSETEKMAEWLQTSGDKADAVYKKIKSSLKS